MTFLTSSLHNISIGQPFALGQRADILSGYLDDGLGKSTKVAVKVLRVPYNDEAARQELRQSLEPHLNRWCALKHPNVADFLGLSYEPPFSAAIILPYYSNGNALNFVKNENNANVCKLIQGTAKGLRYLHEQSIVHADVRACNVLVDDGGNARLVDFALVPVLTSTTFTTTSVVGPARWQAPEVFIPSEDDRPLFTTKSDVFSYSMFAVELLTKNVPFGDMKNDTAVIMAIINNLRPRKPTNLPLADALWPILQQCWEQSPDKRPDMLAICEELDRIALT